MNGENYRDKTPPGEFKVTTHENPLLSITSSYKYKESYQTLWPLPIPNWICIVAAIFPLMYESQYMTK